jgi:hypothetical protein
MKLNETDLSFNQIKNMVVDPRSTSPENPSVGQIYYDKIASVIKVFTASGSSWIPLAMVRGLGTAGYFLLGAVGHPDRGLVYNDKLTFINESANTLSNDSVARFYCAGFSSAQASYAAGGSLSWEGTPSSTTNTTKVIFSNDSVNTTTGLLGASLWSVGVNSETNGYACGASSYGAGYTNTYKLNFSSDAVSAVTLTPSSCTMAAGLQDIIGGYGYVMGGYTDLRKLNFSSDVWTTASYSGDSYGECGVNSYTAGYMVQNYLSGSVNKILFSNDAIASIASTVLSNYNYLGTSGANSRDAGYLNRKDTAYSGSTNLDRLSFIDESISMIVSTLGNSRMGLAGSENLN